MANACADTADVIVVGAGPGGSAAAANLARYGLDVLLLEKSDFPREKVCGDGLTPRTVKALINLGIDVSTEAGWIHNQGLRVYNSKGDHFDLPWPQLKSFPNFGMTRRRSEFDQLLAEHAESLGARLRTNTRVAGPIVEQGRIVGVKTSSGDTYRAPIVVAADGNSARLAIAMGMMRNEKRPMGVAVRAYFQADHQTDDWMESWVEMRESAQGKSDLLPGYVWIFGLGNGITNVGLGMLNTSPYFGKVDYQGLLKRWLATVPQHWGYTEDNMIGKIQGAALPMAYNRGPAYANGLVLVGDSAGLVNPFNGEGISYAMESAQYAAEAIAQAHALGFNSRASEKALEDYPARIRSEYGGYFRLGTIFTKLIGNPKVMQLCVKYGLPRKQLMVLVNKLLADLWDKRDGDLSDKVLNALTKIVPSV